MPTFGTLSYTDGRQSPRVQGIVPLLMQCWTQNCALICNISNSSSKRAEENRFAYRRSIRMYCKTNKQTNKTLLVCIIKKRGKKKKKLKIGFWPPSSTCLGGRKLYKISMQFSLTLRSASFGFNLFAAHINLVGSRFYC